MEINSIQQSTQPNYSNSTPAVKKDGDKNALFGFGFRDSGETKGVIDLADFSDAEIAQKAQEQGLIGKNINDVKTQKQLTEIYKQSDGKTEVCEYYDKENGYRVYSRENLEDHSFVSIVTNEKTGLQQEVTYKNDNISVKNYILDPSGNPVEYKGVLISNPETGKIYTPQELATELMGSGDPDFDIELFLEASNIPHHINYSNDGETLEILLYDKEDGPTALTFYAGDGSIEVSE